MNIFMISFEKLFFYLFMGIILEGSLQFLKAFINSKPPGRKHVKSLMKKNTSKPVSQVTADLQICQATSFQFAIGTFIVSNLVTEVFQSSGFWLTFVWIELLRLSVFLFISWANISSFIQIGIIFDYRFLFLF